ncbi:MAG: superoxide dismutase, partial [Candidatus Pacebacteria bacterium]|nr:superoxide dismutase [Candidatus Paceibacterota bacterium]
KLPYAYTDLEPFISSEQLITHHQKHHASYVDGANKVFEKLENFKEGRIDLDMKAISKELSFYMGGHKLHSLFWNNMAPANAKEIPSEILKTIEKEFGSFERFKKEFTQAAISIEGSGWMALIYDKNTNRLLLMQIEKHNLNIYPDFDILLVLDLWEHAYYIDYKNERNKFIEAFFNIINWEEVTKRFNSIKS